MEEDAHSLPALQPKVSSFCALVHLLHKTGFWPVGAKSLPLFTAVSQEGFQRLHLILPALTTSGS